ncbi:hypothetical protein BYT27DRAFT_7254590 [Phlegmacium glaucopus]|nr:hypothetical protein BYT27DRAFT_7254590 [Phlegmacium glaucopus]
MSKAKKALKITEKLGTVNNETEELTEGVKLLQEKKKAKEELQKLCQSFIKGQGSIYILEAGNKVKTADGISENGPNYVEHAWNKRSLIKTAVTSFLNSRGGSHCIYPKFQEYAIVLAVSASLIDNNTLAEYQSHKFPPITFKENNNGNIFIINGHHRIAA